MNGNKTRKIKGGASPEDAILAESGKEQLHLILMVMCVFLHKYYVIPEGQKQLYPEEIEVIVDILTKLRNQNETKLKRVFGMENSAGNLIREDPDRLSRMDELFRATNAYEDVSKLLKSACQGDCDITVEIEPTIIPQLTGELYKQVSFKFRLVLFLTDIISILKKAQKEQEEQRVEDENDEHVHSNNVIRGKVIQSKLKMYKEFESLFGIMFTTGRGISSEFRYLIKTIMGRRPSRVKFTCKKKGGGVNYAKELRKLVSNSATRLGSLFSSPDQYLRDKYSFLLYFRVFTQFYEDNTTLNIKFDPKKEGRGAVSRYFGKALYDMFQSTRRLYAKNKIGSVIVVVSLMTSQILAGLSYSSPMYSSLWVASKVASVENALVPIVLAPFVDNPLMPIFQKADIKMYNDQLVFQSGHAPNVEKIAEIAENYVRVVAILLSQPMSIKFASQAVDITVREK